MQVVQNYLQPFRHNSSSKCVAQPKIMKNSLKPLFEEFKVIQGIDADTHKKLVTSACYDKQDVCVYLQLFSC